MPTIDGRRESAGRAEEATLGRLPGAAHIGAVHLQTADLQRSIDYYSDILGLEVLTRKVSTASMGVAMTGRVIAVLHEQRGASPVPRRGRFGLFHFAILLPDRAALGRFAAHAFRADVLEGMADHAVSEALYLRDPDGLGIEVYADRPRNTWRYQGGELRMVTEPLQIGAVIAAGGGRGWDGVPAGTIIGHVHLHVGDLPDAGRFYHQALGFDKTVWSYPGALFMSAGGYHHHLGTNVWSPGPSPRADEAQMLEWELLVPTREDAEDAARRLTAAAYSVTRDDSGCRVADPWGTRLHVMQEQAA